MKENANIKDCLREAIRHEEMARPSMPTDINERIMRRMEQETVRKKGQKRLRKLWPWLAAACVAAFILVYTAHHCAGNHGSTHRGDNGGHHGSDD